MKRPAIIGMTLAALIAGLIAANFCSSSPAARAVPPRHMLWAWERPEQLKFVQVKDTGVAYLAATIHATRRKSDVGEQSSPVQISVENRAQPLEVPPNTYLMAVIRIETDGTLSASDSDVVKRVINIIHATIKPQVSGIQIDFDARKSERDWYRTLLTSIRNDLPEHFYLSMTSLASWCLGDDWISSSKLPVDEVVPMFFDMGADTQPVKVGLESGRTFGHRFSSIGIRANQSDINTLLGQASSKIFNGKPRVYMFSHKAWNPDKAQKLIGEVDGW